MYSGREREEDAGRAALAAILPRARPREQVEQGDERGLAAVGERDVALGHIPALLAAEEPGEGASEGPIPLRGIVRADRPLERAVALHEGLQPDPEDHLRGGDEARVAAPEVHDVAPGGRDRSEIVHERARARVAGEPLAERRNLHSSFPCPLLRVTSPRRPAPAGRVRMPIRHERRTGPCGRPPLASTAG